MFTGIVIDCAPLETVRVGENEPAARELGLMVTATATGEPACTVPFLVERLMADAPGPEVVMLNFRLPLPLLSTWKVWVRAGPPTVRDALSDPG
jgi:hypothetical protein